MANSWSRAGPERQTDSCGPCGSTNVVSIEMTYAGDPISVRYCSDCEEIEWIRDGQPAGMDRLLRSSRAAEDRRSSA